MALVAARMAMKDVEIYIMSEDCQVPEKRVGGMDQPIKGSKTK